MCDFNVLERLDEKLLYSCRLSLKAVERTFSKENVMKKKALLFLDQDPSPLPDLQLLLSSEVLFLN